MVAAGFDGFRNMCVQCHGAPGVGPGVNGQGLYPGPPELAKVAPELTDGELFWITKHGIKFTGMPAFGPTHSDEDLWAIVSFIRQLQDWGPEEYERRVAERESELQAQGDTTGGHEHSPGTPEHSH
jgi:mono/diheme cytochrome c family protein